MTNRGDDLKEDIAEIKEKLAASKHYKVIYQDCKTRLQMLADVAYLEVA